MANSGTSNRDVPAPTVDSAIRSSTAPNLGTSPVHSFATAVDNAMRSSSGADLGTSSVHGFASAVDNAMRSSSGADPGTSPLHDFASGVDNAMRSCCGTDLGTFPVHGFASRVHNAMRSSSEADLGTFPVHGFASAGDNVMKSRRTASNLGASRVHRFASAVDNVMRTIVARLSQVVSNATGHVEGFRKFTLAELVAATNNFSLDNKIGAGSFGVVYRGKLADGRELAIKRGETGTKMKKFQEKESAFESELAFLLRLHHKHLVGLVGFCEEKYEGLLVYEYMKNGSLYDHLHDKNNVDKGSSVLNYWKMRIKIALDDSRGIQYLHNYAVPSIIHRDIKSSNILIDATWMARVSDFGLSLMSPEPDRDHRPMKAAGTVGYIDPEYYGLNVLTAKSDVYGLGVVLLELLTGKRAIFKYGEDGGTPLIVVDFAVPAIMAGELVKNLDPRVGPPDVNEAEALELVAYTAMHCVNLEGKDRPTMTDIVVNLERALAICDSSHDSICSGTISVV